jgi:hypothetical protein
MCRRTRATIAVGLAALVVGGAGEATQAPDRTAPAVSLRYSRGVGSASVLNDLGAIKAVGFDAIGWPENRAAEIADLRRQADVVGLTVVSLPRPVWLTPTRARSPGAHVDVRVGDVDARALTPLVWRAIAHGARTIAFDPGPATLAERDGSPAAWVAPAVAIARQLSANRRLVGALQPGPAIQVVVDQDADVDVTLLDGGRAWVLVATSLSSARTAARVTLPKGIPSGLWASWLDDSAMSMLYQATGPVWSPELEAFGARVYFIDKQSTPNGSP